ncbi:hypothetical protein LLH00_17895 [bacterium]|nr:hypothetical protein [bacterium]
MPRLLLAALLLVTAACGRGGDESAPAPAPASAAVQAPAIKDTTPTTVVHVDTVRIAPRDFPGLPASVADWLEARGYSIPQTCIDWEDPPNNVTQGDFDGRGEKDVALLALRADSLELLVFFSGQADSCSFVHAEEMSRYWILKEAKAYCAFSLETADFDYILRLQKAFAGPEPPAGRRHQGINFWVLNSTSEIYYFDGDRWLCLQGAD